ncbi:MAG TPA: cytochrome c biogenesis protein CcdA [Solirubrobacteraceae bacterium]|nr:cytochrome c biogenesis protein CcdA [Solirubrobacteraceae bacterium]
MLVLVVFALLAGAGTALSPCVLPVLPALLSAGSVGGRRRPLGVVIGLAVTFTVTIVGLASVVGGVGLGADPLRWLAVFVLLCFGAVMIVPSLAARVEAPLSRVARFGPRSTGDGFRSGLVVGGALGFVYTPCASPVLAAVISVGAATGRTIPIALAYAAGSAAVLLALTLGGRRLMERARRAGRGPAVQRFLGAVMIATGIAIATGADVSFDQLIAQHIPNVNLTAGLECSNTITDRLDEITGRKPRFRAANGSSSCEGSSSQIHIAGQSASQATLLADASQLPALGAAPEFTETEDWFNTPGNKSLSITGLHGRVVLVDFWTYTCINCIRTLPYLKAWWAAYHNEGLTIVGVETPEFPFEKEAANVRSAIERFGIKYPVVQDNNMGTWNAYYNEVWPADYLIDARGQVRYTAFGEGEYGKTETAIRALLAESGHAVGAHAKPRGVIVPSLSTTPETYLGTDRAERFFAGPFSGRHEYGVGHPEALPLSHFAYSGDWTIGGQAAKAEAGAGIEGEFQARHVYLVLSTPHEEPLKVHVLLDGRPIPAKDAGADVHHGVVTVRRERLYSLVSLSGDKRGRIALSFQPGVVAWDFTFG